MEYYHQSSCLKTFYAKPTKDFDPSHILKPSPSPPYSKKKFCVYLLRPYKRLKRLSNRRGVLQIEGNDCNGLHIPAGESIGMLAYMEEE